MVTNQTRAGDDCGRFDRALAARSKFECRSTSQRQRGNLTLKKNRTAVMSALTVDGLTETPNASASVLT